MKKPILLLLFLISISNAGLCSEIFIHRSLINVYLKVKFPIEKNILNSQIRIENPEINLQEIGQSVTVNFDFKIDNSQKNIEGTIEAQSTVFYEDNYKLILLKNPRIQKISLNDGRQPSKNTLANLNFLTSNLLNNLSIYKLDEKTLIFGKSVKNITIKDSGLEVNLQ